LRIVVKGKPNYWRFTLYSWLLEVRDILSLEIGEPVEVLLVDGESDEPELYINGLLVCVGVPGEEGYLIEVVKKAVASLRGCRPGDY